MEQPLRRPISRPNVSVSLLLKDQPDKQQRRKSMHYLKMRSIIALALLLAVAAFAFAPLPAARAGDDNRTPDLPSPLCNEVQVQPGNKVAFHAYALGVQIYHWNGASWDFVA